MVGYIQCGVKVTTHSPPCGPDARVPQRSRLRDEVFRSDEAHVGSADGQVYIYVFWESPVVPAGAKAPTSQCSLAQPDGRDAGFQRGEPHRDSPLTHSKEVAWQPNLPVAHA